MDNKRWYVLIAFSIVLLGATRWWYHTIYARLTSNIAVKTAAINHLENKKGLIPGAHYQVTMLQQKTDAIKKDIETTIARYTFTNAEEFLEHLVRQAEESGLHLSFVTPQQSKNKNFYEKSVYALNMFGSYEQCTQFFDQFCIKYPNAVVKSATIKRFEETLSIDALIALYTTNRDGL